ncbi:aminodeoxychorismate synthase component I [Aquibaculum sediminis]|uniref:aminodeoxychorismate synthase component I n=1 Tax=Aquibaculum sediminis TaxID=3231907 RepID=UPI003455A167
MRTLIIDNHDSFTFNLFHLLGEVNGEAPLVVSQDACTWADIQALSFDNILISPGPGTPARAHDLGLSAEAVRHAQVPLLGVCLGHQAMVQLAGGSVRHAPEPMHGRLDRITHEGLELFANLPNPLQVVRYHSLLAYDPLPAGLRVTARNASGLIMALSDERQARWGVQFHPESICSESGGALIRNFRDLSRKALPRTQTGYRKPPVAEAPKAVRQEDAQPPRRYRMHLRELPTAPEAETAFLSCFDGEPNAFWLDSAKVVRGLSRWSFLGTGRPGPRSLEELDDSLASVSLEGQEAPFPFHGGWVGWIGYEAKDQCGYPRAFASTLPEVGFLFVDRFLAIDHRDGRAWLVFAASETMPADEIEAWFDQVQEQLSAQTQVAPLAAHSPGPGATSLLVEAKHEADAYLDRIRRAQVAIRDGESYEVCLTNRLEVWAAVDPVTVYRHLRRLNPAPHAAYLRLGGITLASSSPERFLSATADGQLQAKPIKGTVRRDEDPARDAALAEALRSGEKDRAENLMIVDLLRHDLGRVARLGSVRVPALMQVESYATVHQLVSTIEAQLAPNHTLVDAIRAAFPPGSMTGAPKRRTLEIIDSLEEGPRGAYSGALGWIGMDGAADLSVVIRTLVQEKSHRWSLGVGGAITALSEPQAELDEMYLKAQAPLAALALAVTGDASAWRYRTHNGEAAE